MNKKHTVYISHKENCSDEIDDDSIDELESNIELEDDELDDNYKHPNEFELSDFIIDDLDE